MMLSHNRVNGELVAKLLERELGVETRVVGTPETFRSLLGDLLGSNSDEAGRPEVVLAIFDVSGFGREIWDLTEAMREKQLPFVVLSPRRSRPTRTSSGLNSEGVLEKPVPAKALLDLVRRYL